MAQKHDMQGTIHKVSTGKPYSTRNGECVNVRFNLGGEEWFSIKFVDPMQASSIVQQGQNISFQYEISQNQQYTNYDVDKKDITILGGAPQQQAAPQQSYQAPQPVPQPIQQGIPQQAQQPIPQQQPAPAQAPAGRPQTARNGAMVGNALNNAATILGPGASVAQLAKTAQQIMVAAEYLATCDLSGVTIPKDSVDDHGATPAPVVQQPVPVQTPIVQPSVQTICDSQPTIQPQYTPPHATGNVEFDDDIPF